MHDAYDFFRERLLKAREKRGLTQHELGNLVNMSEVTIKHFEELLRLPNLTDLVEVADGLKTTTDYLLGRIDKE